MTINSSAGRATEPADGETWEFSCNGEMVMTPCLWELSILVEIS